MNNKCIGCGAVLQSADNKAFGYIPKNKFGNANYCERCFKITHYNEKLIKLPIFNSKTFFIIYLYQHIKQIFSSLKKAYVSAYAQIITLYRTSKL